MSFFVSMGAAAKAGAQALKEAGKEFGKKIVRGANQW
jgi:hypothetical protein